MECGGGVGRGELGIMIYLGDHCVEHRFNSDVPFPRLLLRKTVAGQNLTPQEAYTSII